MKGAAAGKPGVVSIVDFPEPSAGNGDMVIRSLVCGICATDIKLVQKGSKEIRYALGHELVGEVIREPQNGRWKLGQHVAIAPYLPCGGCFYCKHDQYTLCSSLYNVSYAPGGLAERVLVPSALAERGTFEVPAGLSDEMAALAEPLGCVVKGLEDSHLQLGDTLLVIGDGPMGLLAAAAGKCMGASQIIVAGMTGHRLITALRYYANKTVDVIVENLRKAVDERTENRGADVVLVAVSSGEALENGIAMVRTGGWVNAFAGVPEGTALNLDVRKIHYQQYHLTGSFGTAPVHMATALKLLQSGTVDFSPIVTARYPLNQVAEAILHVENRDGLKAMVTF
jgi:L-iditol 2-dehydrogenase